METSTEQPYKLLTSPIPSEDQEPGLEIDHVVEVDIDDLADSDLNEVLNILSQKVVGHTLLYDLDYRAVGIDKTGTAIHFRVMGYIDE